MPPTEMHRPICILSVGRSGTSLASRVLEELGVDFGPRESMLLPNDWNSQGFWEQGPIMELKGEILGALGGSFWEPPTVARAGSARSRVRTRPDRSATGVLASAGPPRSRCCVRAFVLEVAATAWLHAISAAAMD